METKVTRRVEAPEDVLELTLNFSPHWNLGTGGKCESVSSNS
jgi:hypothetical protein